MTEDHGPLPEPTDPVDSLGTVVVDDRGSLPYLLVHGESLVAAAAWALGQAEVTLVDLSVPWESIRGAGEPFVLHDSLCPLTPPDFLVACLERAVVTGAVVAGVRPVTDTVKRLEPTDDTADDAAGGRAVRVGRSVDRDALVTLCSPVVLPAGVVASLAEPPGTDLTALVAALRTDHEVVLLQAPSAAMRVGGPDDVRLLEALTREQALGQR